MISFLILIATYIAMEGITWCTHKYVMHGLMWYFHEDHHQPGKSFFEKNDAFFLIFAVPSCLLIIFGSIAGMASAIFSFTTYSYISVSIGLAEQTMFISELFARHTRCIINTWEKKKVNVLECYTFHSNTSRSQWRIVRIKSRQKHN
jgi:hypothetical protein